MVNYSKLTKEQRAQLFEEASSAYEALKSKGVSVDMTRGRPSKEQLQIAMPMLQNAGSYNYVTDGGDARNYGEPAGITAARELFAKLMEVERSEVIVFDGSSLDIMYNLIQFAMQFGVRGGTPWNKLDRVKFLCPAPGYDRHFSICENFGIEMITVPMLEDGPDMDMVESLVGSDDSIKGMWCVPKYSNPTGIVFSDEVVTRMAKLKPAAKDFRVFWDNAYIVHGLYGDDDKLKNIFEVAKSVGSEDMIYELVSTSKITFAGSGVAALATSEANVADLLKRIFFKQINPNKVNQVMHVAFLKDVENIKKIMSQHADILRPKFELFERKMSAAFGDCEEVKWSKPRGGYFISVNVNGAAKRIVSLAGEAGVKFTAAGSTYPYKRDALDSNIRIAPSVPSMEEMEFAIDVLISSIKIALLES
ncbi:MAG: aminotransferase class I/II-fold pyridoxal phosphate-dependent enzyme [Clostridiales bacterium]|nr:aminotransferase class I/II-fold pyridoxal phosphate-dependent enzyme [Clostridiales bacterium]